MKTTPEPKLPATPWGLILFAIALLIGGALGMGWAIENLGRIFTK